MQIYSKKSFTRFIVFLLVFVMLLSLTLPLALGTCISTKRAHKFDRSTAMNGMVSHSPVDGNFSFFIFSWMIFHFILHYLIMNLSNRNRNRFSIDRYWLWVHFNRKKVRRFAYLMHSQAIVATICYVFRLHHWLLVSILQMEFIWLMESDFSTLSANFFPIDNNHFSAAILLPRLPTTTKSYWSCLFFFCCPFTLIRLTRRNSFFLRHHTKTR